MKIQFSEARDVKLRNVQVRMEKHGDDDVPAIDLAIGVTGGNALLDMVHPDLRAMLFKPVADDRGADGQQEIDLPVDDRPSVRVPGLGQLKYDREQIGMTLHVFYGASGKADMVLGAVRLSKLKVAACIEGGSCELQFNLSTTDVNEKTIGKLSLLQGHEISITLESPEVEEKPDAGNDPAWPFPRDAKAPQQTPEEALISTAAE